ncbi:MAG: methylmalonyl-CoA epimerase [Deltaproteobacteria bacterium CG03_land_8_20_14_0_80_45_14]|nr:MAG: methylmalonyl-CoA epimerase [Deltaproteobacteria bacterium CG03_land_8_20_14_0_80_45_14]
MIKKIDHIGIAVKDVESAIVYFEERFGFDTDYQVKLRGFHAAFLPTRETPIELIQDLSPDGVIAKFIEKRGEGVHHIAFEVEDIQSALETFRSQGIRTLDEKPREGAHESLVAFLHPKDTYGILIELVEYRKPSDK